MGEPNQLTLPGRGDTSWPGAGLDPKLGGDSSFLGAEGGNYLVSNIVRFEIDFHVEDDATQGDTLVQGDTIYGGTGATVGPEAPVAEFRKPLSYAVIKLTIVSDEGMQLLQNLNRIPQDFDEVIEEHGEVFIRRVDFLTRPL
jgi:hypothetical protein